MKRLECLAVSRSADVARAVALIVVCGCGVRQAMKLKAHEVPGQQGVPQADRTWCDLVPSISMN